MSAPDLVLLSMFVVLPLALVGAVVVALLPQAPLVLRVALPLAGLSDVGIVVVWVTLRLSTFGYWMSGSGPEPPQVVVAGRLAVVAAGVAWLVLVSSLAVTMVVVATTVSRRRASSAGASHPL